MSEVTVVIPNYNGMSYLETCLRSVSRQTGVSMELLVVDNGSTDGSREFIREHFPKIRLLCLKKNLGFCGAVNRGIRAAKTPYVILLNNDTEVCPGFVYELWKAIRADEKRFSCGARLLQYENRELLDNAGDFYCALGWGIASGKGKPASYYPCGRKIFSSCAGAAIYRRELLLKLGGFDEAHFAYLEDIDLSYRARIQGYYHWYEPKAQVFHVGSGTSGSRYNRFKVLHSAGNNLYLLYKNMPWPQILLNSPFLVAGFMVKYLFFVKKGLGRDYREGLMRGLRLCREHSEKKVRFRGRYFLNYLGIQLELWGNIRFFLGGR